MVVVAFWLAHSDIHSMKRRFAPKSLLIVRTDRIGDVILTLPVAQAAKKHLPGIKVGFLCRNYTKPVVEMSPAVDEALTIEEEDINSKLSVWDAAILVHPTLSDAWRLYRARIPVRIGTAYRFYSFLLNRKVFEHRKYSVNHEITYNLHLLRPLGISVEWLEPELIVPDDALSEARKILSRADVEPEEFVAIHPGSGGSALNWGTENFRSLAEILKKDGIKYVVTAGPGELELAQFVAGGKTNVIFNQPVQIVAGIYKLSRAFVGPSTGMLHLADAVGTPAFGIYPVLRVTSATRWGPAHNKAGWISPDLPPCKKCKKSCRYYPCTNLVSPLEVYRRIVDVLTG